ncbi:AmmeMemoRadiSam system protein B [bacterium]|nr:AmmeMemoRadiSam system protein B [bacterium]
MITEHPYRPRLRNDLDLVPMATEDGTRLIVVRDPLELAGADGALALRAETAPVLRLLDGSRTLEDIHRALCAVAAPKGGQATAEAIPQDAVQGFIRQLDEVYLLDNQRFQAARQYLVQAFLNRSQRPAALAGKSYPKEKAAARAWVSEFLGPGAGAAPLAAMPLAGREIAALVAPHIELEVGRKLYAAAYNTLRGRSYDRVVVLGVGHNLVDGVFSITDKDFVTPLGTVPTDRLAVRSLRSAAGALAAPDDFVHRGEHSIEFQVVLLQHVLAGPFSLVPVLCGSLYGPLIESGVGRPSALEALGPVIAQLAALLDSPACRTLLVAGVDFSHVGLKFGDRKPGIQLTREAAAVDRQLLAALATRDIETFCHANAKVRDRYHVCGFSTLALLLEVLPAGCRGVELGYQTWHEHSTQSAVSFGAAAFYRE